MSISVHVQCPHCHSQGDLADPALFGQSISCPACQHVFVAPMPPSIPTPLSAAVAVAVPPPIAAEPAPVVAESMPINAVADAAVPMEVAPTPAPIELPAVAAIAQTEPAPAAIPLPSTVAIATTVVVDQTDIPTVPASAVAMHIPQDPIPAAAGTADPTQLLSAMATIEAPMQVPPAVLMPQTAGIPVVTVTPIATPGDNGSSAAPVPAVPALAFGAAAMTATPPAGPLPVAVATPIATAPMAPVPTTSAPVAAAPTASPAGQPYFPPAGSDFSPVGPAPAGPVFEGPVPAFMAPPAQPGAAEMQFASSLPDPQARGNVKPPKMPSKGVMNIALGTVAVIMLFATVMFLLGDPLRGWGKVPKPKGPVEENPIAKPLEPGQGDSSIEDVFARINAASKSDSGSNDKEKDKK
jgi:hypothetical protein